MAKWCLVRKVLTYNVHGRHVNTRKLCFSRIYFNIYRMSSRSFTSFAIEIELKKKEISWGLRKGKGTGSSLYACAYLLVPYRWPARLHNCIEHQFPCSFLGNCWLHCPGTYSHIFHCSKPAYKSVIKQNQWFFDKNNKIKFFQRIFAFEVSQVYIARCPWQRAWPTILYPLEKNWKPEIRTTSNWIWATEIGKWIVTVKFDFS